MPAFGAVVPAPPRHLQPGVGDRAAVALTRVTDYFDRLLKNQTQFIDVSEPLAIALRHAPGYRRLAVQGVGPDDGGV